MAGIDLQYSILTLLILSFRRYAKTIEGISFWTSQEQLLYTEAWSKIYILRW